MKKFLFTLLFVVTFFAMYTIEASAIVNDIVKVGLRYSGNALYSANLENEVGKGYSFGYYDDDRNFVTIGETAKKKISMTAAGTIYVASDGSYSASSGTKVIGGWHIQLNEVYDSFADASAAAAELEGYPAYISNKYRVRVGCYKDEASAAEAMAARKLEGTVVSGSRTGVMVTVSRTTTVLFEFDCKGLKNLGVLPNGQGQKAVTWFKQNKYYGGFEYSRITGGKINVINVLNVEDYVKGVVPYEMTPSWPLAALEAQAVCVRTYAYGNIGHLKTYGFDLCCTNDCQVYYGAGNSSKGPTSNSNQAVNNTKGMRMFDETGEIINAVYHSSNGGATESSGNVWGGELSYLQGKPDPYESTIKIPNYEYTVTYTPKELTWVVQNSGYDEIGNICNVYVSEYTDVGNVYKVTVVDTDGNKLVVKGHKARSLFLSSTYNKSARSMRFRVTGGVPENFYINSITNPVPAVGGLAVISGSGTVSSYDGENPYIITAEGTAPLIREVITAPEQFVITGAGNGHNVGMSQYGAKAMATLGMTCEEILNFYYTGITIK